MARVDLSATRPSIQAYPGARRFELSDDDVRETAFDPLEHVRMLRDFLAAPEAFLRHL